MPLEGQVRGLSQKYLGGRPIDVHSQAIFHDSTAHIEGGHPVPISNFMNAQCMSTLSQWLTGIRGDGDHYIF